MSFGLFVLSRLFKLCNVLSKLEIILGVSFVVGMGHFSVLLMTIFNRFERGRYLGGIESHVFRPMMTAF